VPDMLQHCQREAEAPPLLLPTSRCLPAKNCGWIHFQDQVKDAIPWQCALPATSRELEELLVWIYDMSKHCQREAPPLLLPFVGCLQPEEEEEDCRWLHSQDQVGCYSVSVRNVQREALPFLLLPFVGGCILKKIVDVCALETWLDAKSVSLLHCHMRRTSRASSHLDLCYADLHTTIR